MKEKTGQALSWLQVNNWVPIIISAVMITISFTTLITRVAVIETKLDNITLLLKGYEERNTRIISDLNDVHQRLAILETLGTR